MSFRSTPLFVLPALAMAATAATAADFVQPEVAPVFVPQTYVSVEGGWIWTDYDVKEHGDDKFGNIGDDDGFYLAATARRIFRPNWDVQLTVTGTWLNGLNKTNRRYYDYGTNLQSELSAQAPISDYYDEYKLKSDLDFQTIDLDIGYHPGENPLIRFLAGVRVLHMDDKLSFTETYNYPGGSYVDSYAKYNSDGWAAGPRIGVQSEFMLGSSRFGLVAEGSGSILWGRFSKDFESSHSPDSSGHDTRTVYNLEGLLGMSWHANERFSITAGYRAQKWWNLRDAKVEFPYSAYSISVDEDLFVHGPFARAAINF